MEKFASRAMLQIIEAGMHKHHFIPDSWQHQEHNSALVPKASKTGLLSQIARHYGLMGVLKLADGCEDATKDPLSVALLKARDPADLLDRWSRVQEHVHSNHRVQWQSVGDDEIALSHISLDKTLPLPEETCFVMAVLVKLMQLIGTKDIALESYESATFFQHGGWEVLSSPAPLTHWKLTFHVGSEHACKFDEGVSYAQRIANIVRDDPCRRWTLEIAAKCLNISIRTLQRRLNEEHKSFQRIVSLNRASIASDILTNQTCSLTEVGFLCGYASSSHFSSSFFKETAFTPKSFRAQFQ